MTSLTMPPMPQLSNEFITDGTDTAIYTGKMIPNLFCGKQRAAATLNCTSAENCKCVPAGTKVRCEFPPSDVAGEFSHIELELPVERLSWELKKGKDAAPTAKIPNLVSSETLEIL
ncbi:unnamed protein product [Haemonchus placei]|uniref:Phlebovirus_G2 domain-containing protein n=1 Tax=Haemonchus placei TaxID=6290 RepID=A0A0N4WIW4_HAEPC|nr:unnamed protein product [Haemonchus placei]